MATMRQWVYSRLAADSALLLIHEGRIFSARGLISTPPFPFLAIDFSTSTDELTDVAWRQIFRVWVHDEPGSYDLIDQTMQDIRRVLVTGESEVDMLACRFSEESPDLRDDGHNSVTRYVRFFATRIREGV